MWLGHLGITSFHRHTRDSHDVSQFSFLLDEHFHSYPRIEQIHQRLYRRLIHYLAKLRSRNRAADNLVKIELGDTMRLVLRDEHELYSAMNAEIVVC